MASGWLRGPLILGNTTVLTAAGNYACVNESAVVVKKTAGQATQITLTAVPVLGQVTVVKDGKGDAATNNITVIGAASATIDGQASHVIKTSYAAALYQWNGTEWNLLVVNETTADGLRATAGDQNLIYASYYYTGAPAATDQVFFVATRALRVKSISCVFSAAAGGASSIQVVKDTGTNAPGAGTDLLTNNTNAGFDLNATANTVQNGTLTATAGALDLAAGNRLSVDFANAIQSSAGVCVTVGMAPI